MTKAINLNLKFIYLLISRIDIPKEKPTFLEKFL